MPADEVTEDKITAEQLLRMLSDGWDSVTTLAKVTEEDLVRLGLPRGRARVLADAFSSKASCGSFAV